MWGTVVAAEEKDVTNDAVLDTALKWTIVFDMSTAEIEQIIARYVDRERQEWSAELSRFPPRDVEAILSCLEPEKTGLDANPCGPPFNTAGEFSVWMNALRYTTVASCMLLLLPCQVYAAGKYWNRGRLPELMHVITTPNKQLVDWNRSLDGYIKPSTAMVQESIERGLALCVNKSGNLRLLGSGYSTVSHVWAETMGWETPTTRGAVGLSVRRKGLPLSHLQRFFEHCKTPVEWLWLDVIAIPEILEDMDQQKKLETERLRTECLNNLRSIYSKADACLVFDTTLLRLHTESVVDAAAVLILSYWPCRIWCLTEAILAPKILLQTATRDFDLDHIMDFLDEFVPNDQHRYFPLFLRLHRIRPGNPPLLAPKSLTGEIMLSPSPMARIYHSVINGTTDVELDLARAIFPILDVRWTSGWTLTQGFEKVLQTYPNDRSWVAVYLDYHKLYSVLRDLGLENEVPEYH